MDLDQARVSPSIVHALRQSGAAEAAAQGLIHVISVDAIRDVVGSRWPRHQSAVEDFVLRSFKRGARDDDFVVRVNDCDFILIQPGRDAMSALSRASQLMRETLNYFLGASRAEDIRIALVEGLDGDGMTARPVVSDEIQSATQARTADLSLSEDGSPPWERFGVSVPAPKVVMIRRPDGSQMEAVFWLEPVWKVTRDCVVSFTVEMAAFVIDETLGRVPLDEASMTSRCGAVLVQKAMEFARETKDGYGAVDDAIPWGLHLPMPFDAVTHSGTRMTLLAELKKLSTAGWRERLFLELTGTPPGLPQVRLSEIVAQLTPYGRAVMVRTLPAPKDLGAWARSGLTGLVLPVAPDTPERVQMARLDAFARQCDALRMVGMVRGITSRSLAIAAWGAGLTMISGPVISERFGAGVEARRFPPIRMYQQAVA